MFARIAYVSLIVLAIGLHEAKAQVPREEPAAPPVGDGAEVAPGAPHSPEEGGGAAGEAAGEIDGQPEGPPAASSAGAAGAAPDDGEELSAAELAELTAAIAADSASTEATGPALAPATASLLDLGVTLSAAGALYSVKEPAVGGEHDPEGSGFHLQALELVLGGAVDPYFRFDAALVVSEHGVDLEEAYASTDAIGHNLLVRAGQFLSRAGRIAGQHPHQWRFVDQSLLVGRLFGGEGPRSPGLELSYLSPLPWFAELVLAVNEARGEASARSFLGGGEAPLDSPGQLLWTATLEQFFDLGVNWSLLLGTSYLRGPNGDGDALRTRIVSVDVFLKYRPISRASYSELSLQVEYAHRRRWDGGDRVGDHNGYAELGYRFARRWSAGARLEFGTAELGRSGEPSPLALDPQWSSRRDRSAGVLTFSPTEFSRLRLQLGLDRATWFDEDQLSALLSLEIAAGAHGAHAF